MSLSLGTNSHGARRAPNETMRPQRLFSVFVLLQASVGLLATAQEPKTEIHPAGQEFTSVIRHFEEVQRNTRPQTAYQVVREYRITGSGNSRPSSEVLAQVDYLPPNRKTYSIQKSVGSSRGEEAVKRILDRESALAASAGASSSSGITSDNYTFSDLGHTTLDGRACYLIGLSPKRRQQDLIAGQAWVDESTFLIRRIEGQLAKSPSWWLKTVSVQLDFSELSGIWLQTGMVATADVRFIGKQTLQARTLDHNVSGIVAAKQKESTRRRQGIPAELLFDLHGSHR
jgi:hypothetical protein